MDTIETYKTIVAQGELVTSLAASAKEKTNASDKLGKLMISAILQNNAELNTKLNNLFVKDAVFYSLRKIKAMASYIALNLSTKENLSFSIKGKENLSISLAEAKENKWNTDVKISSLYSSLKEEKTGVNISDKQAFLEWCNHNKGNEIAMISFEDCKEALPEETLETMLQEGRAYKEASINEAKAQAHAINLFEAFKALPPTEAYNFLMQAQEYLDLQETKVA